MFFGQAQSALDLYVSAFADAHVASISTYGEGGSGPSGTVERAILMLGSQQVILIDSPPVHDFSFTPTMSLHVEFDAAAELDSAFAALADGGRIHMPLGAYPFNERFGWLQDRFGVSWQLGIRERTTAG